MWLYANKSLFIKTSAGLYLRTTEHIYVPRAVLDAGDTSVNGTD